MATDPGPRGGWSHPLRHRMDSTTLEALRVGAEIDTMAIWRPMRPHSDTQGEIWGPQRDLTKM